VSDVIVSVAALSAALRDSPPPVLLDVRWRLGDPDGRGHYLEGHIPGAVYVDLDTELAGAPSASAGRHPLPAPEALEAAARRWGISRTSTVVAYDDIGNLSAARAWWLLRWGGLTSVHLLDGGLQAWRRAGLALETEVPAPQPGNVVLSGGALPVLDADDAALLAREGVLLDARAVERFRGDVEPIDPRAGHIPGARSAPTAENLDDDHLFRSPNQLAARFAALGVSGSRAVGVYCGSGITAAHEVAALAVAGIDAALYAGSWSQWSCDPKRPVAAGD
jgi:thiosulfate/3-mercaptopyruvate sulfurtransferase